MIDHTLKLISLWLCLVGCFIAAVKAETFWGMLFFLVFVLGYARTLMTGGKDDNES